jgi:mannose-6-phosphate isomerase-like protein (cupin superfamily)
MTSLQAKNLSGVDEMPNVVFSKKVGKLAIILKSTEEVEITTFFSSPEDAMQIGLISTDIKRGIPKHKHLSFDRNLNSTSEFLLVRRGACTINLWGTEEEDVQSFELNEGDGVLLLGGIHSINSQSKNLLLLEVKQGPYAGSLDKILLG